MNINFPSQITSSIYKEQQNFSNPNTMRQYIHTTAQKQSGSIRSTAVQSSQNNTLSNSHPSYIQSNIIYHNQPEHTSQYLFNPSSINTSFNNPYSYSYEQRLNMIIKNIKNLQNKSTKIKDKSKKMFMQFKNKVVKNCDKHQKIVEREIQRIEE